MREFDYYIPLVILTEPINYYLLSPYITKDFCISLRICWVKKRVYRYFFKTFLVGGKILPRPYSGYEEIYPGYVKKPNLNPCWTPSICLVLYAFPATIVPFFIFLVTWSAKHLSSIFLSSARFKRMLILLSRRSRPST